MKEFVEVMKNEPSVDKRREQTVTERREIVRYFGCSSEFVTMYQ